MELSEHILDVDEATFETEVVMRSHEVPVVVDFWAPWCGPCHMLSPVLERLAIEAGGAFRLAKINVDDNPALAIRFGVQGIPAVKAFRNGEVAAQFVGAQPEAVVRRFVEGIAPAEADQALEEAATLLATRHWSQAEDAYRAILEEQDANPTAALGLLKALLMQGEGEQAIDLIEHFPSGTEWVAAQQLRPLAQLLAEGGGPPPDDDPNAALLHRAGRLIAQGNLAAALDGLLEILREDKKYRNGFPKDVMLALFVLLGDDDPMTREYREELASVLF